MDLTVWCTGESRGIKGDATVATYGFLISRRSRLLHRERGVVCIGRSATAAAAGLGAVLRALQWLRTAESIDRVEVLTDCQEAVGAVEGTSGKTLWGLITLTTAVERIVQALRRRAITVTARLMESRRLCHVAEMASKALWEYLRHHLWPGPGVSPAPLVHFLRPNHEAKPEEAGLGLIIICDGGYRRVGSDRGVAAYAWVASRSARPLHQESGVVLSRSKTGSLIAEYKAIVAALRWLDRSEFTAGARVIEIRSDCESVVNRLLGRCRVRSVAGVDALHRAAEKLRTSLEARGCELRLWHVPRPFVRDADRLCRRAYGQGADLTTWRVQG